jgi:hypothetical protein
VSNNVVAMEEPRTTTAEFAVMRTQVPQMGGRFLNADDGAQGRKVAFIGW